MALTAATKTDLYRFFTIAFNAAPGVTYMNQLAAASESGMTVKQIVEVFTTKTEFTASYPTFFTNSQFATKLVNTVVGSSASDAAKAEAVADIEAALAAGLSKGTVIFNVFSNLAALAGDAKWGGTATQMANKVAVAQYYTEDLLTDTTNLTTLRAVIANVTNTTNVSTPAAIQAVLDVAVPAASLSFTLTSGADAGASVTGGAGADTYVGTIASDRGTGTTVTPGDNLNGQGGVDSLLVSVSGTHTAGQTHGTVTLANIEKVLVSNFETSGNNDTFDASLWTGLTNLGLSASSATGDVLFTNVGSVVTAEMSGGSADLTITYQSTLLTGTADTQSLALNGATTAAAFNVGNGGTGFAETLAISSTGSASSITTGNNQHKTITVTGDKNLTLAMTDTANVTTKVDASAFTGNLTLSGLGTTDIDISGGSGNDTVTVANLGAKDTISGGAGTDTLKTATAITSATGVGISGFEVLEVTGNGVTQAANAIAGVTSVSVNDSTGGSANGTITFSGMGASTALTVKSVGDADDDVTATLATNTLADAIGVTLGTATAGVTFDVLTLDNYETITLDNAGAASKVGSLTSASATKVVINASKATTITALSAASLATVDASASTANVTVGATSRASTITGGAGNDDLTGSGSADSIIGGAGNDTLAGGGGADNIAGGDGDDSVTGGAGNDVVDGGAGNDIFTDVALNTDNFAGGAGDDRFDIAAFADLTSADTVAGGDGTDTINFTADGNYDFTADVTILTNVTSVERYQFSGLAGGNDTVTVNDGIVSAAGGTLTLVNGSNSATTFNASGVLASNSKVALSSNTTGAGAALTYSIGNGVDQVTLGTAADTVIVTNNAYLSANDSIAGGTGSDTLSFTFNTASSNTISAAQLSNITGFETFSINNGTDGTAVNYAMTLTDTIVGAQIGVGSTFTVTRDAGDTGTTKVDASAVTSSYVVALTGGTGNDTLSGGAGNDTITGGAGSDSLTGGAGNDTFVVTGLTQAANGTDAITDFSFGAASTSVDRVRLDVTSTTIVFGTASAGITAATGTEILVMDQAAYQDVSAAQTAVRAALGANDNAAEAIIIWQDTLGNLNLSVYADSSADATANGTLQSAMVRFVGSTLGSVGTLIGSADFDLV
jgi:Ca2+-binding RTX toxin-like protein